MRAKIFQTLVCMSLLMAAPSYADTPASGDFLAKDSCPALKSIRRGANPGNVMLEPGRHYAILSKNKPDATHYLLEVVGAEPSRRWVAVSCGEATLASGEPGAPTKPGQRAYVLAVSWQPAFCEQKPEKTECETQKPDRFDATHFTLHGLWPQPSANSYCNVERSLIAIDKSKKWEELPAPEMSPPTRVSLNEVMPGTMSFLERHEWIKHGTCFNGEPAEAYFARAVALMKQLNSSKTRELFSSNIGRELTRDQIRAAFDESFGAGAGSRIRIACKRVGARSLITEITVGLAGEIGDQSALSSLIAAAPPTDPGCPAGVVDEVNAH